MPNFWSKSGQFISEKIFGSRTKDEDFNKVCETMKSTENGLSSLKSVIQNFSSYSNVFKKYFSEINTAFQLIYANSPFSDFVEEITVKHQIIQAELEEMKLIYTERTNGKYVTEDIELITKLKDEYAITLAKSYFEGMKRIGLGKADSIKYLEGIDE